MWNLAMFAMWLGGTVAEAGRPERRAVAEALRAWVTATDVRNADAVEAFFLPDAVQRVRMGDQDLALTTEAYVGMLRAGKIGGGTTRLEIHEIAVRDGLATAVTTRTSDAMVMHDALILEHTSAGWRVASASIHAVAR